MDQNIAAAKRQGKRSEAAARRQFAHLRGQGGYGQSIHYVGHDGKAKVAYYETEYGFEVGYARIKGEGLEVLAAG